MRSAGVAAAAVVVVESARARCADACARGRAAAKALGRRSRTCADVPPAILPRARKERRMLQATEGSLSLERAALFSLSLLSPSPFVFWRFSSNVCFAPEAPHLLIMPGTTARALKAILLDSRSVGASVGSRVCVLGGERSGGLEREGQNKGREGPSYVLCF
jgi:hypothetical protein